MKKRREPKDVIKELNIGGKIRELRMKKGYTLKEISDKTGFSTALLSQIENNVVSPPISTLWKIAEALGVKIGYFFQETAIEGKDYCVVRKGEGKPFARKETYPHMYFYSLAFGKLDRKMDPFLVVFEDDDDGKISLSHEGEEFLYILEGQLDITLGDTTFTLAEGDSIYFDSRISHHVRGKKGTKMLAVLWKLERSS